MKFSAKFTRRVRMKTIKSPLFGGVLMALISICNHARAEDSAPPTQYPLSEVVISIRQQTLRGIAGYEIGIGGDGNGYYRQNSGANPTTIERRFSNSLLIELLNDFYRIHFFELADSYQLTKQVVLRDDGTVATTALKMADAGGKTLCVQLADYRKCVTIFNDQPPLAAQLIAKIEHLFVP